MEVDESNVPAEAAVTDEDLLFGDDTDVDAVGAEYTSGEVDQLLGEDDEETTKLFAEEGIDLHAVGDGAEHEGEEQHGEEDHGEGEEEEEEEVEDGSNYGYRGRGMRRPFFRGMRGGRFMMRGRGMMMMMGPPR